MWKRLRLVSAIATIAATYLLPGGALGADETQPAATSSPQTRAVMTGEQVVRILDETVDWYRTLGAQQQSATQPSDLLILYANRQTADKVGHPRVRDRPSQRGAAEQRSGGGTEGGCESDGLAAGAAAGATATGRAAREMQAEIATSAQVATGAASKRAELQTTAPGAAERARPRERAPQSLGTMSQFAYQSDANGSGASALKEHIDAIAASIPSSRARRTAAAAAQLPRRRRRGAKHIRLARWAPLVRTAARRLGIWDLAANVLRLSDKIRTIDSVDRRTAALQDTFTQIRTPPLEQINGLSARGDALAQQADLRARLDSEERARSVRHAGVALQADRFDSSSR